MLDAETLARRGSFVEHRGVRVLVASVADLRGVDDLVAVITHVEQLITAEPVGSVRIVIDVRGFLFDRKGVGAVKGVFARMQPHVKYTCLVGVTGLHRILLQAINTVARRERPLFDTVDQAKDWLAAQP